MPLQSLMYIGKLHYILTNQKNYFRGLALRMHMHDVVRKLVQKAWHSKSFAKIFS